MPRAIDSQGRVFLYSHAAINGYAQMNISTINHTGTF